MKTYGQVFAVRGSAYDRAMQCCPDARQQEFAQAVDAARLTSGMVVADVPAGGGYLQRYLPSGCHWLGHEPCASFTNHGTLTGDARPLLPLPWSDASADVAISLAGVHHIDDKRPLFRELARVTKPGGRLVVSDVATDSAVARFLEGYVGPHNSNGHQGGFLDGHTLVELRDAGWSVHRHDVQNFCWVFPDRAVMAAFCHELFDLRSSSMADTRVAIETQLGVKQLSSGQVGMDWSLMTIVAQKGPTEAVE